MARPMPQRMMQSSRRNIGGGGGNNRYADEEYSTSQYSGGEYYDDDYYEDEYDDDDDGGGYDDYDDDYDNNDPPRNFRRSSGGAARNNYGGGGGGGRHRSKAASFHDNRDYNRRRSSDNYDYDDNRGHRRGSGGGGRGGRQQHHRRSNSANNAPSSSLHIMLPGTPKQAQDIIRKYTLGMTLQSLNDMALPPTSPPPGPAREIATLTVANLLPQEYAFVRRSNGQWTFAQVAVKHEQLGQLVFIVNKQGSTKSFKRMEWSGFVRRIKGTERKVTLPPQITASGEQQQQQHSSGNQDKEDQRASPHLAIENGPSTHNNSNNNNRSANPSPTPGNNNNNNNKLPDISQMSIKEMKLELTSHNINYESFMDKQEFRNAIIDARAEAVKNALIREQQQMQEKNLQQQQERLQSNYDGFGNYKDPYDDVPGNNNNGNNNNNNNNGGDEAVPISTLDADLSNLAGQTITLQPMNDDEVSELMGDYLLTEYKFQMKVLEKERQKKQKGQGGGGGNNKLGSINEGGGGGGLRNSQMSGSFNIEAEDGGGGQQQTHYEKQAFAKSQKWGSLGDSNV